MKKIIIRCITEPEKGFGNLSRCITLANSLKKLKIRSHFVINYNKQAISNLQGNFSFSIIKKNLNYNKDHLMIKEIMFSEHSNILLIDMREFGEAISKKILNQEFKIILIDDAWGHNVFSDVLINGTVVKKYLEYKNKHKNSKLFLGPKYWIAEKEFEKFRKDPSTIKFKKKFNVTISLGGSDPDNLGLIVTKSLMSIENIKIILILGPFFKNKNKILKQFINHRNITIKISVKKIWKEFEKSDLTICNGGNTLFELAIQGVPCVAISASEHQIPYIQYFHSKNFCHNLGWWKNLSTEKIQNEVTRVLLDDKKRQKMSLIGPKIIDGKGLERVVKIIKDVCENFS